MKLSLHGPVQYLEEFDETVLGFPEPEYYGLAHACFQSSKYFDFLKSRQRDGTTLILDNGADELGVGMSGDRLLYLIGVLDPDIVVLPDVLKKSRQTITASEDFLLQCEGIPLRNEWMAVAQGKTLNEWMDCFKYWLSHPDVSVIGVPYDIDFEVDIPAGSFPKQTFETRKDKRADARLRLLEGLVELLELVEGRGEKKTLHLLGANCPSEMQKLTREKQYAGIKRFVRSHDTTMPFAAHLNGRKFNGLVLEGEKDWPPVPLDLGDIDKESHFSGSFTLLGQYIGACGIGREG